MNMKKHWVMFTLIIAFFLLTGGTCDHTRLTGEIVVPATEIAVGEVLPLVLEVPEELSGIYRVEWHVDPPGIGEIIQGERLMAVLSDAEVSLYFGEAYNPDRMALFRAAETGSCRISVTGFYKQTNPQDITYIDLIAAE